MNYPFVRNLLNSVWQTDLLFFVQNAPLRDAFLRGLDFEFKQENPFTFIAPSNGVAIAAAEMQNTSKEEGFILVTNKTGVMMEYDAPCGEMGTRTLAQMLTSYDKSDKVKGHIIVVDSGGGQSSSVKPLNEALLNLTKPSKILYRNLGASAAYGAFTAADEIYAEDEDARIGSIGTMIQFEGYSANHKEPDGLQHIRLYASKSTEKGKEFEEALNKQNFKAIIDNTLDPVNEQFIKLIQNNRPQVSDQLCTGKVYKASEVVGTLIDGIKTFEELIASFDLKGNNDTTNSHNHSHSNSLNMKIKTLSVIGAAIGVATLETSEGGIFLNEEQADKVAAAIEANNNEELQAKLDQANEFNNSLNEQLAEKIEEKKVLAEENAVLKQNDGDDLTSVQKKNDGDNKKTNANTVFDENKSFAENLANEEKYREEWGI